MCPINRICADYVAAVKQVYEAQGYVAETQKVLDRRYFLVLRRGNQGMAVMALPDTPYVTSVEVQACLEARGVLLVDRIAIAAPLRFSEAAIQDAKAHGVDLRRVPVCGNCQLPCVP